MSQHTHAGEESAVVVPVLIVGGGASGLASSLLLSTYGVESLLIERRPTTSELPKAHILNQRTMEILDTVGLADAVYEQGSSLEAMGRVAWYTSLAGPTPLHGRQLAWRPSWGGGADRDRYARVSPRRHTNLPQMRLEPILRRRAEELAPGRVRYGHELLELHQDADGVTANVRERDTDRTYTVRAAYLLGADGGRTVGGAIGATLEGQTGLVDMVSTHVIADLSGLDIDPQVSIFWFVNPDVGGSIGSGVLIKMGGAGWGPSANEWVFAFATGPEDPTEFDAEYVRERMRAAVGVTDLSIDPRKPSRWHVESVVADRFAQERVFLLGDAAHRHPPTGALGLNTAIQDAHNLAWKLALVLRGDASAALLDSYETERRPVAIHNAKESLESFFAHAAIDEAIGITPEDSGCGWRAVEALLLSEVDGVNPARERLRDAVQAKGREFSALRREIGFRYQVPGGPAAVGDPNDDGCLFESTGQPGERIPHAWVEGLRGPVSTLDLVAAGQLTLIIGKDGAAWNAAAQQSETPLKVVVLGTTGGYADPTGDWTRRSGLTSSGAMLVRPDQHIAWRERVAVEDPSAALVAAVGLALRRPVRDREAVTGLASM